MLEGITPENQGQITKELYELRTANRVLTPEQSSMVPTPTKRQRNEEVTNLIQQLHSLVMEDQSYSVSTELHSSMEKANVNQPTDKPKPRWADIFTDKRDQLTWTSNQVIIPIGIMESILTRAVVDTGASKTLCDLSMAQALGLPVVLAKGDEFGKFSVPGNNQVMSYAGIVRGPVIIRLSETVSFSLPCLKLINHTYHLMLLGGDIIQGGRSP